MDGKKENNYSNPLSDYPSIPAYDRAFQVFNNLYEENPDTAGDMALEIIEFDEKLKFDYDTLREYNGKKYYSGVRFVFSPASVAFSRILYEQYYAKEEKPYRNLADCIYCKARETIRFIYSEVFNKDCYNGYNEYLGINDFTSAWLVITRKKVKEVNEEFLKKAENFLCWGSKEHIESLLEFEREAALSNDILNTLADLYCERVCQRYLDSQKGISKLFGGIKKKDKEYIKQYARKQIRDAILDTGLVRKNACSFRSIMI